MIKFPIKDMINLWLFQYVIVLFFIHFIHQQILTIYYLLSIDIILFSQCLKITSILLVLKTVSFLLILQTISFRWVFFMKWRFHIKFLLSLIFILFLFWFVLLLFYLFLWIISYTLWLIILIVIEYCWMLMMTF